MKRDLNDGLFQGAGVVSGAASARAGFPGQSGVCRDRQSTRKLSGSEAFPKQEKAIR